MNIPAMIPGSQKRKMKLAVNRNLDDFTRYFHSFLAENTTRKQQELDLLQGHSTNFWLHGYCRACDQVSQFRIDIPASSSEQEPSERVPNWRETLICKSCYLNNRLRFAVDCLKFYLRLHENDKIYLTEQLTPLFEWIRPRYPQTIGSEFLAPNLASGSMVDGIRHEDLTSLSFADDSLDFVISFDVFEHIPDYQRALAECVRCLREGGKLVFTVPFRANSYETLIRAKIDENGNITHLQTPEYHGNPTKPNEGILCFYHFGWDVLDYLRNLGVTDVYQLIGQSRSYGYLGNPQSLFVATK